jgi:hypothetical protein
MRMPLVAISSLALVVAAPAVLLADGGSPPPAPELQQLGVLVGSWKCEGKQNATELFGPAHAVMTEFELKATLDGSWYTFHWTERKTKENPTPMRLSEFWGYDAVAKRLTREFVFDGAGRGSQSSPGWEGDKLVFTGELVMGPQKVGVRQTFIKKGDRRVDDLVEVKTADKWIELGSDRCRR